MISRGRDFMSRAESGVGRGREVVTVRVVVFGGRAGWVARWVVTGRPREPRPRMRILVDIVGDLCRTLCGMWLWIFVEEFRMPLGSMGLIYMQGGAWRSGDCSAFHTPPRA